MTQTPEIPPRLAGRTVLLLGGLDYHLDDLQEAITAEGGRLAPTLDKAVGLIIDLPKKNKARTQALNQAKAWVKAGEAAIEILDYQEFQDRFQPTADEAVRLMRGSDGDRARLRRLLHVRPWNMPKLLLQGEDLAGVRFGDALVSARLEGCDLSGADVSHGWLGEVHGCKLDGANLDAAEVQRLIEKSTLVGVSARGARFSATDSDLTEANLEGARQLSFRACILRRARLAGIQCHGANFAGSDFEGASFEAARLDAGDFSGAVLRGANLAGAVLSDASFVKADLSGANLRGARLTNANLTDANVEGADFTGALTVGANLAGVNLAAAIGLSLTKKIGGGPKLAALVAAVKGAGEIQTTVRIDTSPTTHVEATLRASSGYTSRTAIARFEEGKPLGEVWGELKTLSDGMLYVATTFIDGTLKVESIKVKSKKSPVSGKALGALVVAAWCEVFSVEMADPGAVLEGAKREARSAARSWIDILRSGTEGVERWNGTPAAARPKQLRNAKLAGAELAGLVAHECDLSGADLAHARLPNANLYRAKLTGADLSGADLASASFIGAKMGGVRLDGARLADSSLRVAWLQRASLVGADLTRAELSYADLRGADLTGASLAGAKLDQTIFDETTKWPAGFELPQEGLIWKGKGRRPPSGPEPEPVGSAPIDVATFMQRLAAQTDESRLEKTLKMLKADRFKLFVEVGDDKLAGVVKSQTDEDLVYACSLAADGGYACCTQNLNPCGGLRGALCKHLLVLIIGLVKGGEIDPARVDGWIRLGRGRAAALDKEAMTPILLRFKGAETGEIDWRPMETVPEDYYAM